jgi:hypothetical protein
MSSLAGFLLRGILAYYENTHQRFLPTRYSYCCTRAYRKNTNQKKILKNNHTRNQIGAFYETNSVIATLSFYDMGNGAKTQ